MKEALAKALAERERALADRLAYEQMHHDCEARLTALIEYVGWEVALPVIRRVDKELSDAR